MPKSILIDSFLKQEESEMIKKAFEGILSFDKPEEETKYCVIYSGDVPSSKIMVDTIFPNNTSAISLDLVKGEIKYLNNKYLNELVDKYVTGNYYQMKSKEEEGIMLASYINSITKGRTCILIGETACLIGAMMNKLPYAYALEVNKTIKELETSYATFKQSSLDDSNEIEYGYIPCNPLFHLLNPKSIYDLSKQTELSHIIKNFDHLLEMQCMTKYSDLHVHVTKLRTSIEVNNIRNLINIAGENKTIWDKENLFATSIICPNNTVLINCVMNDKLDVKEFQKIITNALITIEEKQDKNGK